MKARIIEKAGVEYFAPITVELVIESKGALISFLKKLNLTSATVDEANEDYYASVSTLPFFDDDLFQLLHEKVVKLFGDEWRTAKKAGD